METILFYILAGLIVSSAFMVVVMTNPVFSTLSLIVTLIAVAGLFGLLGAPFLAVTQVIVYAGAIVVLVLFVIMLLNVKSEQHDRILNLRSLSVLVSAAIFISVVSPLVAGTWAGDPLLLKPVVGRVEAIGHLLFDKYVFPFEVASILIMVALVGAVMLASNRNSGRENL